MIKIALFALLAAPPLLIAGLIDGWIGPFWSITISRIDVEGYPVYTVWRNGIPFADAPSRGMAESYVREYSGGKGK